MAEVRVYVLIEESTGMVENKFLWDGTEESGWFPPEGRIAIQSDVAQVGWKYLNGEFIAPPEPEAIPPTPQEIFNNNQAYRGWLLGQVSVEMTPVLLALQLDVNDETTAKARAWQDYYRAILLVDLTVANPQWPEKPSFPDPE